MGPHRDLPDRDYFRHDGLPHRLFRNTPPLTREQVDATAKTYLAQVFKIPIPQNRSPLQQRVALQTLPEAIVLPLLAPSPRPHALTRGISVRASTMPSLSRARTSLSLSSRLRRRLPQIRRRARPTEQKIQSHSRSPRIQREYGLFPQPFPHAQFSFGPRRPAKGPKASAPTSASTEPPADMFADHFHSRRPHVDLLRTHSPPGTPQQITPALKHEVFLLRTLHPMDAENSPRRRIGLRFHGPPPASSRRNFPARLPRPAISHDCLSTKFP